jgi:hypothetical protein
MIYLRDYSEYGYCHFFIPVCSDGGIGLTLKNRDLLAKNEDFQVFFQIGLRLMPMISRIVEKMSLMMNQTMINELQM